MSHRIYSYEKTCLSMKQNSRRDSARNKHVKSCIFRVPLPWNYGFSPYQFLKGVAETVAKAMMCFGSTRRPLNRSSSSSMGSSKLVGSSSVDYYRAAAVEDCIEFIHTSFSRSNSVSTTTSRDEFVHTFLRNFESLNQ